MPSGKLYLRAVTILKDGPATSPELAAKMGIDMHSASSVLAWARKMGLVNVTPAPATKRSGRPRLLYSAAV